MLNRILELLSNDGALTIDELAQATGASTDALRGMLDTLARRRLVEWKSAPASPTACDTASTPPVVVLCVDRQAGKKTKPPA